MSNLVINVNSIYDRVIRIGRQTENLVSEITFNLNMWIEEYGAGECVLNVRRNGDGNAYPVPMTIVDGMTTWTITDTDTAKKGRGEIQLFYTVGEKVKTSPIFTISCGESLVGGEVPEPYEDWLTELNRMTAQVEAAKTSADQSAQAAQTAAGTAAERASEAEQSANTASGFANNASASAQSASESAQAAAQSAEQAAESVSDIEASAQAASQSAQSAESAKQAAQTASESAQGFAQTASEKASEAAESAAQAQASADRANVDILRFLPTDSASGAIAQFSDGADNVPLKSLVVGINPVQSGEGDPSPDNVRPIIGWTGMTVNANGTEIPISWESEAGTVYGGTLDVLTGMLTVDKKYDVYDGSNDEIWYMYGRGGFRILKNDINEQSDGVCNIAPAVTSASSYGASFSAANCYIYFFNSASLWGVATVEELRTWLATHNIEVCYRCTKPQTYQLTPAEVKTLLGQNNIWADTGDTSVEYRADIQKWVEKKLSTRSTVSLTRSMPVQTEDTDTELLE